MIHDTNQIKTAAVSFKFSNTNNIFIQRRENFSKNKFLKLKLKIQTIQI